MIDFDPRTKKLDSNDVSHSETTGRDSSSDEQAPVNKPSNEVIPKRINDVFLPGKNSLFFLLLVFV